MKKRLFVGVAVFALSVASIGGCAAPAKSNEDEKIEETRDEEEDTTMQDSTNKGIITSADEIEATDHVNIEVKDYGTISIALAGKAAPETVENFTSLVKDGFYDGLTFHRIISGFMIQGGDPLGNGTGGSDKNIKGEFASNGFENNLSHVRGAISMARSGDPNSASSQFFIVHEDSAYLDGEYACFGFVKDGMDVVDAICKDAKPVDNNGTMLPEDQPVIEKITIAE